MRSAALQPFNGLAVRKCPGSGAAAAAARRSPGTRGSRAQRAESGCVNGVTAPCERPQALTSRERSFAEPLRVVEPLFGSA